jgi:hypothetical protein
MTAKAKFILALIAALCSLTVVVALANTIYLPQIEKSPTVTPTATHTLTVTPTRTLSITLTPTRTTTPKPGVYIVDIVYAPTDPINEYVEIHNSSSNSTSLEGWWIKEVSWGYRYDFPDISIGGGKTIRVWTRIGANTSSDLYWGRGEEAWKDNGDTAYLRNANGDIVDTYEYSK